MSQMNGFIDIWFLLVEVLTLLSGIGMVIVPGKMYTLGSKGRDPVPPKHWPVTARILGVIFIAMGGFFLYLRFVLGVDMSF